MAFVRSSSTSVRHLENYPGFLCLPLFKSLQASWRITIKMATFGVIVNVFPRFLLLICALSSLTSTEDVPKGHLQPLGSHRPAEGSVETLDFVPSPSEFYDAFVVPSKPVIFKGAGKASRGFYQWTDDYLRQVLCTHHVQCL